MLRCATVCLCLCVLGLVDAQPLQLSEGDVCKEANGRKWVCKKMNDCPKFQEDIKVNITPTSCATVNNEPLFCCEPPRKSKQMCEKYAEFAFQEVVDPLSGKHKKVDSCAVKSDSGRRFAQPREYPHMALIGYGGESNKKWGCGGSLISERYILSAAYCTDIEKLGQAKWARLGEYKKRSTMDDEEGDAQPRDYEIIDIIIHPNYSLADNNLALYKLKDTVEFNEYIRPICLNTEHQFSRSFAIATGWGKLGHSGKTSDVLKRVNVTITTMAECSKIFPSKFLNLISGLDDNTMICTENVDDDWDTCRGDGGGPLQIPLKHPYCMYTQIGINSFGRSCGGKQPSVYTSISPYVEWIEGIVWP